MAAGQGGCKAKIFILVLLVVIEGFFHFLIPTDSHTAHRAHIVLRKLYYLPSVTAGANGEALLSLDVRELASIRNRYAEEN